MDLGISQADNAAPYRRRGRNAECSGVRRGSSIRQDDDAVAMASPPIGVRRGIINLLWMLRWCVQLKPNCKYILAS